MNVVDVIIIFFLLGGALLGFKRGFIREIVSFIGIIFILILSYILKNPMATFLYTYLPFFKFGSLLKGATVLNIFIYEWLSFYLVFGFLFILFKLLLLVSKIFEKILSATIILGIPSKILGMIIGVVKHFVILYIILFVFSIFHVSILKESKLTKPIITKTPILSSFTANTMKVMDEFALLKEKYKNEEDASTFNLETLDLFLQYKITRVENVETLIQKKDLKLDHIDEVLDKYR